MITVFYVCNVDKRRCSKVKVSKMAKVFRRWGVLMDLILRIAGRILHSIGQMCMRTLIHLQQQVIEGSLYFAWFI